MFLPVGTDAPIYHRPFATVGLIVANVVTFVLTRGGTAEEGWLLTFGQGLHPPEWVASAFLHFGIFHLLGNMVFLWTFGLIVEGKLGWWRFLTLYLSLCAMDGAVTQTLMLGYDGIIPGAGGASGVIYALMAMALVWAPKNCIDVVMVFGFGVWMRVISFDVTILMFALFYIGLDVLFAMLAGFSMGTPLLHVLGAVVGFPVGVFLLLRKQVDCEGWDLFSVWQGKHLRGGFGEPYLERSAVVRRAGPAHGPTSDGAPVPRKSAGPKKRLSQVRKLVGNGQALAAWTAYRDLRAVSEARLDADTLRTLIDELHRERDWPAAVTLLEEYVERFPQGTTRARLMLAGLLVREQRRPRAALRVLEAVTGEQLTPEQQDYVQTVRITAERQIDEGVMELQAPLQG